MYAAQEMFKTANKVTRPEKALILGFMAGSRGNAAFKMKKKNPSRNAGVCFPVGETVLAAPQRTPAPSRATSSRSS